MIFSTIYFEVLFTIALTQHIRVRHQVQLASVSITSIRWRLAYTWIRSSKLSAKYTL